MAGAETGQGHRGEKTALPTELKRRLGPAGIRWLGVLLGAVLGHREFDGWG